MKDVLVSIVVPIYNQERYLHTSIPCLMEQAYKNIEIILVNDGSTDGSKKIIENYSKVDKRISCIDKKMEVWLMQRLQEFKHRMDAISLSWIRMIV